MLTYQQFPASWYSSEKPVWTSLLKNLWWKGRQFAEEILSLAEFGIVAPQSNTDTLVSFNQLSTEKLSSPQPFWSHSNIMLLLRANLPRTALSCFTENTSIGFYSFQFTMPIAAFLARIPNICFEGTCIQNHALSAENRYFGNLFSVKHLRYSP